MGKRCYGCMRTKKESPICEHCGFDETDQNSAHHLPLGAMLQNRYLLGKVLGQGGFGITYLAWDTYLEAPVAIKEYYPNGSAVRNSAQTFEVTACEGRNGLLFEANKKRFIREARALAKFADVPEIVTVYNLLEENNTAYIVMEYVEGGNLRDYIKESGKVLSITETVSILQPVVRALKTIHGHHLIHRDVSPDNIMVQPNGVAKLLDFGTVRDVFDSGTENTISTMAVVKPGFSPMEQYQTKGVLGTWTDVYALCATIYYCLTGQTPPDAPARVMGTEEIDWNAVPGLSPQQLQTLEKGMAFRTDERISSVEALNLALKEKKTNTGTPPKDPETTVSDSKGTKKSTFGILIAAIILFSTLGLFGGRKADSPPSPAQTQAQTQTVATVPTETVPETTAEKQETVDWRDNVLMASPDRKFEGVSKAQIQSVSFLPALDDAPEDAWDVSADGSSRVLAWVQRQQGEYALYIAAEGGINGANACKDLFYGYLKLSSIHFNDCFYTQYATDMSGMFHSCQSLRTVDVSGFDISGVTDMSTMFFNCPAEVDIRSWDISGVENYANFMDGNDTINDQPWIRFFTSSARVQPPYVTASWYNNILMYHGDSSEQYVFGSQIPRSKVKYVTFQDSTEFVPSTGWDVSMNQDGSVLAWAEKRDDQYALYIAADGGINGVVSAPYLFCGFSGLEKVNFNEAYHTEEAVSTEYMFAGCKTIGWIDLEYDWIDLSNVTNMANMFNGCESLTKLGLYEVDTEKVRDMSFLFSGCKKLTYLNLRDLDTMNVENMNGMFWGCKKLEYLDTSSFDTSRVTNMDYMFYDCLELEKFDTSGFDVSMVYKRENPEDIRFMNNNQLINGEPWENLFF